MNKIKLQCVQIAWQSEPAENLVGKKPVKEDINFPKSLEEFVGSFSLCPTYSKEKLRRIRRRNVQQKKNRKKQLIQIRRERL